MIDSYEPGPSPSPEYTTGDGHTLRVPPGTTVAEKNRSTVIHTNDGTRISPGDTLHIDRLDECPYTLDGFYEVKDANLSFASLTSVDDADSRDILATSLNIHWEKLASLVDAADITVTRSNPPQ